MNKNLVDELLKTLRKLKPWHIFCALVVSGLITGLALRDNNNHMISLEQAVFTADKNNGDVKSALNDLRSYVYGHMNTNLASGPNAVTPPIQLKYTYDRLTQAEQNRVAQINSKVYTDAQNYCQQQNSTAFSGRTRVPCIEDYVSTHGAKPQAIPAALYEFDFASPTWSPDLAGFSLILTIILSVAFAFSWLRLHMFSSQFKKRS